jgi:hypothetical protein
MTRTAIAAAALALLAVAGCATTRTTFPPPGSTPAPAGDSTAAARQVVIAALASAGLQAIDATRPFRPPEGPLLAAAPRTVLEVPLPEDPQPAWIVLYALGTPDEAARAARDHAAYLASGTGGRALFAPGTQFVLQVVNSTVIFFSWLPAGSPDQRTATIAETLAAIGTAVPVPA